MKYIVNYKNNTVCECEVLSKCEDEHGYYFDCLVYSEETGEEIEVQSANVYDSKCEANVALRDSIESDIASQKYAAGYCYACGYYD